MEINTNTAFYDAIRQIILSSVNDTECDKEKFLNIMESNKIYCDNLLTSNYDNYNIFNSKINTDKILKINNFNENINIKVKINVNNHIIGQICGNLNFNSLYGKNDLILFTKSKII